MKATPIEVGYKQVKGRLTVTRKSETKEGSNIAWYCVCSCSENKGQEVGPWAATLIYKEKVRSCGCLLKEIMREKKTTHGKSYTSEYVTWADMKARCNDLNNPDYGGRGITYCKEWETFEGFFADMDKHPPGKNKIERLNNDGNYEPHNCIWADSTTQNNNTRRNKRISYKGETKNLGQWATILGCTHGGLNFRMKLYEEGKMTIEEVFETPFENQYKVHEYKGKPHSIMDFAKLAGVSKSAMVVRMKNSNDIEDWLRPKENRGRGSVRKE